MFGYRIGCLKLGGFRFRVNDTIGTPIFLIYLIEFLYILFNQVFFFFIFYNKVFHLINFVNTNRKVDVAVYGTIKHIITI